jgi:hypothetical protein
MFPIKTFLKTYLPTARSVITHPLRFFQDMPVSGGFKDAQWFTFLLVVRFQCSIQAIR